ncbi:MAG: YraN family protein [Rickettsiales bacterium]|jgi:putative endonuclease|nr:YraN family protein [Rickettsiales bacterium]
MGSHSYGRFAEFFVALVLRLLGYTILVTRYRTRLGEIDIIAKRNGSLVAFEVKARKTGELTTELVSRRQLSRIENAMNLFLAHNESYVDYNVSFGIILFRNIFNFRIFDRID